MQCGYRSGSIPDAYTKEQRLLTKLNEHGKFPECWQLPLKCGLSNYCNKTIRLHISCNACTFSALELDQQSMQHLLSKYVS